MTLQEWLAWAPQLDAIYQEELGRSCYSDPEAFVNWTYHWRENGSTADEIRAAIRTSEEWRQKHGAGVVDVPPVPSGPVRVLRVTDERDGELLNRTYSYWPNAVIIDGRALVFVGHVDERPRFFTVDLGTGEVERRGALVPYRGTGEGWYWDAVGWIYLCDGPRLRHVHPVTGEDAIVFDISDSHPGCILWQAHSSEDGQTHCATVKRVVNDGAYPAVGTVVYRDEQWWLPARGVLDESQLDASGRWLMIKEDHDNRILDVDDGTERVLTDAEGALGHSDCGHGFAVGEDDQAGAAVYLNLETLERRVLFHTWNMGHVSVRGSRCLFSGVETLGLVSLPGGDVLSSLLHGMTGSGYDHQVHANLSPCGRVASYVSNAAGRFDMYLLVLGGLT